MKSKAKSSFTLICALGAAVLFSACGGGESDAPAATNRPAGTAGGGSEQLTPERTVVITANDQMKFNLERIEASPGEVLELTLNNVGTMPKFSMGHNVVILQLGADTQRYIEAAANAATHDYVPPEMNNSVVAATKLLGGGESDSIVFRVPARPGDYPYVCSFPGHYQVGMQGVLSVR